MSKTDGTVTRRRRVTSPLGGEVGARSAPGEGANVCSHPNPLTPTLSPKGRGRRLRCRSSAYVGDRRFSTILVDPPWQFTNKTGKVAPEHKRLSRYGTMTLDAIEALPVGEIAATPAHLYLWCPNAMLPEGLAVMQAWGFTYKSNIVWHKVRKDGGSDGRGVGFYFRNVTELILFGVRGKNARTLAPGRRQVNLLATRKREHSRKPDEQYDIIEACSPGPYLNFRARNTQGLGDVGKSG